MNTSIPFVYRALPAPGEGTRWIRLQQENDALEAVTVAEAAQAVDNVFGLTPCFDSSAEDSGQGSGDEEEAPPRERFDSVMAALMTSELCSQPDYWTAHVLVLRSHDSPEYVLRGEAETGPVTIATTERITRTQREELDLSSGVADLSWPYADNLIATAPANITLTVRGSTVYASQPCGRITVRYRTSYDRVSVRVPVETGGSQRADGTVERPDLARAVLIAFWGTELATELELSPPAQDTAEDQAQIDYYCKGGSSGKSNQEGECWKIRRSTYLCNCSKEQARSPLETRVSAPCPKGVKAGSYLGAENVIAGYLVCPGEEDEVNDPEFYEATCCTPPPVELPRCRKTYAIYRGGAEIKGGADYYRNLYGANVQLTAVSPEGGICGEEIREWDTTSLDCCDDITPLSPNPNNPSEFHAGEAHWIGVLDGKPGELIWEARGGLYFWSGGRKLYTIRTPSRWVLVYAESEGVCPEPSIKVDDGCEPLEMTFVGGGATPLELPDEDYVAAPEQQFVLQAGGGVPPMRWQVGGQIRLISWDQDTGRSALFEARQDFCGTEDISVIDVCGDEATVTVRSTEGHWEEVKNFDECKPPWKPPPPCAVKRTYTECKGSGGWYVDNYRGFRARLCAETKNISAPSPNCPHEGDCSTPFKNNAVSPCGYKGRVLIRDSKCQSLYSCTESQSSPDNYTKCYALCRNVYWCVRYSDGTSTEVNNYWQSQSQWIVQLWRWVCPKGEGDNK